MGHFDISASHFVTVTNMTIFWSIFSAKNLVPQGYTIYWDYQSFENTRPGLDVKLHPGALLWHSS